MGPHVATILATFPVKMRSNNGVYELIWAYQCVTVLFFLIRLFSMKLSDVFYALSLSLFSLFASPDLVAAEPVIVTPPAGESIYDPTKPASAIPAANPVIPALPRLLPDTVRASGNKAFLWEVKSKTNVVYLFGTIHVGKRNFYPLPPQVEAALKLSQRLVVEADISNTDGLADIDKIINYVTPDSLDKHIPPPLFERLKAQLTRLKIPLDAVKPMKPYLIGGFLSIAEFSKLGYDMNFGVDGYLIAKAKEDARPILELESQAGQLKMLDGMSPELQVAFLENAIRVLESGKAPDQVTGMVNAWQTGDVKLMQDVTKAVNDGMRMSDQLDEVLLYSRHDVMQKKIEGYLAGSVPHFVAVGSLHLVGPRGLVEILKARGFEVKQL